MKTDLTKSPMGYLKTKAYILNRVIPYVCSYKRKRLYRALEHLKKELPEKVMGVSSRLALYDVTEELPFVCTKKAVRRGLFDMSSHLKEIEEAMQVVGPREAEYRASYEQHCLKYAALTDEEKEEYDNDW